MTTITQGAVQALARVCRLELSAEEARALAGELAARVELVERLWQVDVAGVAVYTGDTGGIGSTGLRADTPGACLALEQVLAAAPAQGEGRIAVPRG